MKKQIMIRLGSLMAFGVCTLGHSAAISFRYPVGNELGAGWLLNRYGLQWLNEYNYGGNCGKTFHPGVDFNMDNSATSDSDLGQPVYATADGIVQESYYEGGSTWGNIILISHDLPTSEIVLSVYGHLDRRDVNINAHVTKGQQIGTVGKGVGLAAHLHFEIRKSCMAGIAAKFFPCGNSGYDKAFVETSYYDPEVFIKNHNSVGSYSDGFHADGTSRAFVNAFNENFPRIGQPVNNVHKWTGSDPKYRVWLQDFQGDMGTAHFGTDGQTAIILNDYPLGNNKAYLVKEGMWGYYKTHDGPFELGEPFTEEITLRFANSQFNQGGNAATAGDTITVQKFMRVYDSGGQPAYNNERRTLVYNNSRGGNVVHFAVGEFSIGGDTCPDGEQIYVQVDSNPANDIVWPLLGALTPTGKWFTKSGRYNFVRHQSNGQRLNGWGVSAVIGEGNHQSIGSTILKPVNLAVTAETPSSARLTFSLPGGRSGYNVRVYQDNQRVADMPATENCLVSGLSPNTYYCFRVSAVDNDSGLESDRSLEACAATPPSYTVSRTTFCKSINIDCPCDPINETTVFYNSNNYVYAWIELDKVYGYHSFEMRWFDPNGNLVYKVFPNEYMPDHFVCTCKDTVKAWCGFSIACEHNYGVWRVETYVDDNLVANDNFSLAAGGNRSSYSVNRTSICKGVDTNNLYNPTGETTVFYNTNNLVYSWIELDDIYGTHNIKWVWVNPDGNLVGESSLDTPDPCTQYRSYWEYYKAWCWLNIAANTNYGNWQVKTYVDGDLVANVSFSLVASNNSPCFKYGPIGTCKDAGTNRPPPFGINETTVFYNSNNFVYSWMIMTDVHGVSKIKWRWFDPAGNLASESLENLLGPIQGFSWTWGRLDISTNVNYGIWRVATYVDDNMVTNRTFTLASLPPFAVTLQIARSGTSNLLVTVNGSTNSSYTVQSATNIAGPWTDYITVYNPTNGVSAFTVPNTPSARFFR